ncbi:Uncharacterised protein [Klebsiella oxytoca]|nr:Uncharacterised protein [Klebsiella oxytoca]
MFCRWENVLDEAEIRERLGVVRARAHVRADLNEREWRLTDSPVNVSAVPDETVFPGPASKTVEYDSASGRAMIWWTSRPSGAFQIVQRRQSGLGELGQQRGKRVSGAPGRGRYQDRLRDIR